MDELKHYGVKGMKWGIRRPIGKGGLIVNSTVGRKVSAAKKKHDSAKKRRLRTKSKGSKKLTKSPLDMSDKELKDHHARLTATKKLQREARNKNLDAQSRASAEALLRTSANRKTSTLQREATRLETRSRQLQESRPSYGKKPGVGTNLAKRLVKVGLNVATEKAIDKALGTVISKSEAKAVAKITTEGMGNRKPTLTVDGVKKGVTYKYLKDSLSKTTNIKIDRIIDDTWAKRYDRKHGWG